MMNDNTKTNTVDLEAKGRLAKLLATENITIVHRQVPTATFDSIKRVLTLPIWKDMSNELYNMLVGHEVGHALYTCKDMDTYNRAVAAVDPTPANRDSVKSFLNIVEDARIERLTMARFPGLRHDFKTAYKDVMDRDFFGIKSTPGGVNAMSFIDRLNIHCKVGIAAGVKFNATEQALVDRVNAAFTWDDMVAACAAVYAYSKTEQNGTPEPSQSPDGSDGDAGENGESSDEAGDNGNSGEKSDKPKKEKKDKTADNKNKKKADNKEKEKSDNGSSSDTGEDSDGDSDSDSDDDTAGQTDGDSGDESGEDSDGGGAGNSGNDSGEDSDGDSGDESGEDGEDSNNDSDDSDKTQGTGNIKAGNRGKGSKTPKQGDRNGGKAVDNPAPAKSKTQDNYDNNSGQLVNSGAADYIYLTIPEADLKKLVVPHKTVHDNIRKFYANPKNMGTKTEVSASYFASNGVTVNMIDEAIKVYEEFRRANDPVVNYMVKEFNMRKAADETRKAATARTGDLDLTKLASYKFSDNLFKKVMVMPTGKNHGLVMFIDWSGSMSSMMGNMIEQLITLVSFCRKVNIPFEVYGFGAECNYSFQEDTFNYKENDISLESNFHLRQYFGSGMSANAFNQACVNMMALALAFSGSWRATGVNGYRYSAHLPAGEGLGGTPLTETIVASYPIMKEFKEKNSLQFIHMVILTDGDGNGCCGYRIKDMYSNLCSSTRYFNYNKHEIYILRDPVTKKDYRLDDVLANYGHDAMTGLIMTVIKARLGMNVIGFYIIPAGDRDNIVSTAMGKMGTTATVAPRRIRGCRRRRARRFLGASSNRTASNQISKSETQLAMEKQFDEERYVSISVGGFDEYFIISGDSKTGKVQTGTLNINPNTSAKRITDAFIKQNQTTIKSRTLMGRFISLIAKGKEN